MHLAAWLKSFVILALPLGIGLSGCTQKNSDVANKAEMVNVSFGVQFQPKASLIGAPSFSLADTTLKDFEVEIRLCSSGFEYDLTSTTGSYTPTVRLYNGDTDCVAGLRSFTWNTVEYTKDGGGTLTSGNAIFVGAGGKQMQAAVYIALDTDGIVANSKAHFVVGEIIKGSGYEVPVANYSEPTDVLGNVLEAPNFTIASAFLTAVASGTGAPTFTITFDCIGAVSGNTCATPTAVEQDMQNMKVAIVWDDPAKYNVPELHSMTFEQAEDVFDVARTSITAAMVTNSAGVGAEVTGIVGEGPLDDKKEMLVVVQYEEMFDATPVHSYRYFTMTLADGMNP